MRLEVPRVHYWNSIPSPHAVALLNVVAARRNVALEVWICSHIEPDRLCAVNEDEFLFPWRYPPGGSVRVQGFGAHCYNLPVGLLTRDQPDLFVSPSSPVAMAAPRRAS